MKFLFSSLLLVAVGVSSILLTPTSLPAVEDQTSASGPFTFQDSELTFRNGFWWKGEDAFLRFEHSKTTYTGSPGYWVPHVTTTYDYYKMPVRVVEKIVEKKVDVLLPPAYGPDWKEKLLEVIKAQNDQQAYLLALQALGYQLGPNGTPVSYSGQVSYSKTTSYGATGSAVQLSPYAVSGDTLYGYSLKELLYGDNNPGILYQQAARLTQNAQQLAGQANTDFVDLVGRDAAARARIAEILAKGQVIAAALQAAGPAPVTQTQTRTFTFQVGPDGNIQVVPTVPQVPQVPVAPGVPQMPGASGANDDVEFRTLVTTSCASCHNAQTKKGGLDISTWSTLDPNTKAKYLNDRVFTKDEDHRMPKGADGSPGRQLTEREKLLLATH